MTIPVTSLEGIDPALTYRIAPCRVCGAPASCSRADQYAKPADGFVSYYCGDHAPREVRLFRRMGLLALQTGTARRREKKIKGDQASARAISKSTSLGLYYAHTPEGNRAADNFQSGPTRGDNSRVRRQRRGNKRGR